MTSQHKTGAHPFYIGMYIHIYTHIFVHIYTSQKECLHIFFLCVCVWGCLCFVESKWAGMSRVATTVHLMITGLPTPKLSPRNKGFGEIL